MNETIKLKLKLYRCNKSPKLKNELIEEIKKGCGNKVDHNGDCWYISSQGNKRFCSSCSRALKELGIKWQ